MKMEDAKDNADGWFTEYKEATPFWNKRLRAYPTELNAPYLHGVFLVGREVHHVAIVMISKMGAENVPERYREAIRTPTVWAIWCREVFVRRMK
mgnify:CR=1 FL=1